MLSYCRNNSFQFICGLGERKSALFLVKTLLRFLCGRLMKHEVAALAIRFDNVCPVSRVPCHVSVCVLSATSCLQECISRTVNLQINWLWSTVGPPNMIFFLDAPYKIRGASKNLLWCLWGNMLLYQWQQKHVPDQLLQHPRCTLSCLSFIPPCHFRQLVFRPVLISGTTISGYDFWYHFQYD